jgi:hypothetical protein
MNIAVKISLAAAGFYLLTGMITGVIKYQKTMQSAEHRAPVYIDIAHRAAFLYSFAALVMAKLLEENSFSEVILIPATIIVLIFFSLTILGYLTAGLKNETENLFRERNFITTWFMYALIAAEIGGFFTIFCGFLIKIFAP